MQSALLIVVFVAACLVGIYLYTKKCNRVEKRLRVVFRRYQGKWLEFGFLQLETQVSAFILSQCLGHLIAEKQIERRIRIGTNPTSFLSAAAWLNHYRAHMRVPLRHYQFRLPIYDDPKDFVGVANTNGTKNHIHT